MKSAEIFLAVFFVLAFLPLGAAPSPWDSWRSGYTNFEQGESFRERGSYTDALKYFEKARKNYQDVRSARPDWNQRVIADRLRDCDRQISELRRLLGASSSAKKNTGSRKSTAVSKKDIAKTAESQQKSVEIPSTQEVVYEQTPEPSKEYETEIANLKRQLIEQKLSNQRLNSELQKQRKFEDEIASLLRDRKVVDDRYALLEKRYRALEIELKRPNEKIVQLEQQLINEKLTNERIAKQYSGSEQQLKIEKENSRLNQAAKKALEDLLKKRDDELLQKNHEVSSLMDRLKEIVKLNDRLSEAKRIAKLQDVEIKELQRIERERLAEIDKLRKSERERIAEIEKLQQSEREKLAEIDKLRKSERERIAENKDINAAALKKIAESKDVNAAALKKIAEMENAHEETLKKLSESEKNRETALSKLSEIENARETILKKLSESEAVLKRANALWLEEKKSLETKITDLTGERDGLTVAMRKIQDKNNSLTSENRTLSLNWEQEKNAVRLNAAELSGLRERNRQLEEDLKLVYKKAEDLEKRLATRNSADFQAAAAARNSMKQMENNLLAAQNQLISLRAELDAAKGDNDARERKLKAVNDENLKARAEVVAALEKEKVLQQELTKLRPLKIQLEQLQRNFNALAAENRENRLLVEAAKPRQAELEKAKLRLVENDRLKNELAKEQQLNAELKSAYNKDQNELRSLRKRAGEFEAARRKMVELEARAKEAERLQNVEKELLILRQRETELAELKIKFNELGNSLRKVSDDANSGKEKIAKLTAELTELQKTSSELEKIRRVNRELEAMINSQNSELDKLNKHIAVLQKEQNIDPHTVCRMEAEKLRAAAASAAASAAAVAGPLRDRIQQLQRELVLLKQQRNQVIAKNEEAARSSRLKDSEIKELRRLNAELVEFRNKSANELLAKVDASKVARLEDELTAINKLNAELAAERDKLAAQLNNRNSTESSSAGEVIALQSDRSPEELAGAGLSAEKDGKTELAIWHYKQAIANNKDFAPAHFRLGMIYYRRGSFADAAPHLSAAFNADPSNRQLALTTARCFIAVSRFGNAKTIIDPLLKSEPENAGVLLCAALIDAGCGAPARAEEKLLTAARIVPDSFEIQLELSKLLASSISDRRREAVIAYEKARELGSPPEPAVEKMLGTMLDHRRELVKFMSGAAREAEINSDWGSAVWYYKKIISENHPGYIPLLAFAQWKSGNASAAKETLEFNKPSRNAMVVKFLIAYAEKDNDAAMRAAQQSVGAVIPADWVGVNLELEKLKKQSRPSAAVKVLLKSLAKKDQQ